jgi:hypothetical protein
MVCTPLQVFNKGYAQSSPLLPKSRTLRQPSQRQYNQRVKKLTGTGVPKKEILYILDQLIQTVISDLQEQSTSQTSPLALKGIQVRSPLSPQVADWFDLRFSTLIGQQSQLTLKMCTPCQSQRTFLENGAWVIQHGYPMGKKLADLGQKLGIKRFIDFDISWNAQANTVILRARLFDVKQARVLWEEDYRSHPITTKIERQGEGAVLIGKGIYEHQKKVHLNSSDYHLMISFGYGFVPTQIETQTVYDFAIGYGESFGDQDRFRYQLVAEPFFNIRPGLLGWSIAGELHWRLTQLAIQSLDSKKQSPGSLENQKPSVPLKILTKKQRKQYTDPLQGFWINSGVSMMYIDFNQGVALQLGVEYITSIHLGMGFDLFYGFFDQDATLAANGMGGRFKLAFHF